MDLTPQQLAHADAAFWATLNRIRLQKGVWSFEKRPYLLEPMQRSLHGVRRICIMKATQGGFSEMEINQCLWGLIHGYYPAGVMYLFPTMRDVTDFSKMRFGPLLANNPSAIGQFVKDTDTANLKQIGNGWLLLRGARLSEHIEAGSRDAASLRGVPADKTVYDEFDLMDEEVPGKAQGRMGDSDIKEEAYISNPTFPGRGIDTIFARSDQRYWWRRCPRCGLLPPEGADWEWFSDKSHGWTSAEVYFPDLVAVDHDGKGYIACAKCGKPVGLEAGQWVPKEPTKTAYMRGYQWSQLSSAKNDPYEILQEYTHPADGNLGDVVRMRLGRAHADAADQITTGQVLAHCGQSLQLNGHPGPCAMGADIKSFKNIVIGCRVGQDRYRIVRVARVESMDDIMSFARRFNVRTCVMDVRPYTDEARRFQKEAKFKTWLCSYSDSTPLGWQFNESTGICTVNRTEALDASGRLLKEENHLELPALCPEIKRFAEECSVMMKCAVIDQKTRATTFRYVTKSGKYDDYRHALTYWWLAMSSSHLPVVGGSARQARPAYAKNEYCRN